MELCFSDIGFFIKKWASHHQKYACTDWIDSIMYVCMCLSICLAVGLTDLQDLFQLEHGESTLVQCCLPKNENENNFFTQQTFLGYMLKALHGLRTNMITQIWLSPLELLTWEEVRQREIEKLMKIEDGGKKSPRREGKMHHFLNLFRKGKQG